MGRFLLRFFLFLILLAAAGELFFRYVVVASNTAYKIEDKEFKVMLHDTAGSRKGVYTTGRLGLHRSRWQINHQGWKRAEDYESPHSGRKPVIAVIGDSYIAGFQVAEREHLTLQLEELLSDCYHVYNLGQGGTCASQFLHVARYAEARFDPDLYVVLVRDGDWKQSITYYIRDQRTWQLRWDGTRYVEVPAEFQATRWRRLPKYCAIIRYFVYNVNLDIFSGRQGGWRQAGTDPSDKRKSRSDAPSVKDGMFYIVRRFREEIPYKPLIFMYDAQQGNVYKGTPPFSQNYLPWLQEICIETRCDVLDLGDVFADRWAANHRRFDFGRDYHWNAYGHRVVAEGIYDHLIREGLVVPEAERELQAALRGMK
ncbi:hypothetical protein KKH27_10480 [bacterium]|nr:hypothetical protein [bacterium]MBU1984595.1 hypothetical protein [bacterium]